MASKTAATMGNGGGVHADQAVALKNKGSPTCSDVAKPSCKHRYELVCYDALPAFLKHDEFILDHYRSEWPVKQAILSAFALHNETINVWTHLIGFFIFLALTMSVWSGEHGPVTRWPFYTYLCGAMFCLLMSSGCHLLACHSEHATYVLLRLDYAGITGLIVTSFYPVVYYTFLCDPFSRTLYLGSITICGAAAVAVSLLPVFQAPDLRWARAALFACMGASGIVPIVHKMLMFHARPEAVLTTGYEVVMGAFYLAGVLVYATRMPERFMPGMFDLVGHSHQLFHVLVIAGAYAHYHAGLVYLSWRDRDQC
ncbi:heptahelical transmembrane protein 4-like [Triticum dicoccoides]|uniref:heptahelical transmembrane protein 4-like n=1 Tax=Triticum dicoccoides TaxID=85692 RepID=UPI00188E2D8F|nr:heptahelical transmembrane protein 4-like [Triticum dicoccoides]